MVLSVQNLELYMSNTHLTGKRLARWFLINLFIAAALCAMTGRNWDPWLWGYIATVAAIGLLPTIWLDDDLARNGSARPSREPIVAPGRRPTHRAGARRRRVSGRALAD